MLFRLFLAFCLITEISVSKVTVINVLSYLEYLTCNGVSPSMLSNHLSALETKFTMYGFHYEVFSHPTIQYFVKSVHIHRPISVVKHNIIDQTTLSRIVSLCNKTQIGQVFKAVFLVAFLAFSGYQTLPHILFIHLTKQDILLGGTLFSQTNS